MQRCHVYLDETTIREVRRLSEGYGRSGSLSAVVRRAISLLADHLATLQDRPILLNRERLELQKYLPAPYHRLRIKGENGRTTAARRGRHGKA